MTTKRLARAKTKRAAALVVRLYAHNSQFDCQILN